MPHAQNRVEHQGPDPGSFHERPCAGKYYPPRHSERVQQLPSGSQRRVDARTDEQVVRCRLASKAHQTGQRVRCSTSRNAGKRPQLLDILEKPSEPPLIRANALGYLSSFPDDPRVFPALLGALSDPEPAVRVYAALRMNPRPANKQVAVTALVRALDDSATTVRVAATVALVSLGISQLPGEDGERFELAKQVFRARAELNSDDAAQLLGAGKFYLLTGDPVTAVGALQNSLKLDPGIPARYYLAYAKAQQGHLDEARQILEAIPPTDSQYANAQNLLKTLAAH